ncbi:hypothetical protein [Bacillus gaemokensis]|uniref:Uncharacterized protein n=1 Tax=Bacillus gaemokensis TaxID=574375 RepID=A0A073K7D5_9BACI|nr:hypothetical protein [Bacillus gaemokensis]KEK22460.1 hypothetical protein BAGA_18810 [Bacillus gaemokensis]KYG28845.1 hypothetical protein AZF08_14065 [Bacillus gaemokensis]
MKCTIGEIQLEGTTEEITKFVDWYKFRLIRDCGGKSYGPVSTTSESSTVYSTTSGGGSVQTSSSYPITIPKHDHTAHHEFI